MTRSLNGNLRGIAARQRKNISYAEKIFSNSYMLLVNGLREKMGLDEFDEWYDSYPENMSQSEFYVIMAEKLNEFESN